MSTGFLIAPHAHNQLLQSLSSAGAIGAAGLLFYVLTLIIYASRAAKRSEGMSMALVALMLIRSFTETPFNSLSVMQLEFFVHLLAMVACIGFSPEKQVVRASSIRGRDLGNNRRPRRNISGLKPLT
jgi:O-antigen ligase